MCKGNGGRVREVGEGGANEDRLGEHFSSSSRQPPRAARVLVQHMLYLPHKLEIEALRLSLFPSCSFCLFSGIRSIDLWRLRSNLGEFRPTLGTFRPNLGSLGKFGTGSTKFRVLST